MIGKKMGLVLLILILTINTSCSKKVELVHENCELGKNEIGEENNSNEVEMKIYKLNEKGTLEADEIPIMLDYMEMADWEKYREIIKNGHLVEFDLESLLKYASYTKCDIKSIYNAYSHFDGASADAFGILLVHLHKNFQDESMELYSSDEEYKESLDILMENMKDDK